VKEEPNPEDEADRVILRHVLGDGIGDGEQKHRNTDQADTPKNLARLPIVRRNHCSGRL